jgi:hypothetical protein
MLLISSSWKEGKTFKMIPLSKDCPYVECIYDPQLQVLAIIGTTTKDTFHMVPKIDVNGDYEKRKSPAANGNPYKEERKLLETFQEYYLEERAEIEEFVKRWAANHEAFDYKQYLDMVPTPMPGAGSLNMV